MLFLKYRLFSWLVHFAFVYVKTDGKVVNRLSLFVHEDRGKDLIRWALLDTLICVLRVGSF